MSNPYRPPLNYPLTYEPLPVVHAGQTLRKDRPLTFVCRWSSISRIPEPDQPTDADIWEMTQQAVTAFADSLKEVGVVEAHVARIRNQHYKTFIDIVLPAGTPETTPNLELALLYSLQCHMQHALCCPPAAAAPEDQSEDAPAPGAGPVRRNHHRLCTVDFDVPTDDDCRTVFIGKLYGATEEDLARVFSEAGLEPTQIRVPRTRDGKSKEIAYAVFKDRATAAKAASAITGAVVADSHGLRGDLFVDAATVHAAERMAAMPRDLLLAHMQQFMPRRPPPRERNNDRGNDRRDRGNDRRADDRRSDDRGDRRARPYIAKAAQEGQIVQRDNRLGRFPRQVYPDRNQIRMRID